MIHGDEANAWPSRFIVLGSDTDAGKTTFALHWLASQTEEWAYWKPLETGESDSATVRRILPATPVHEPVARFTDPVAPPLAARRECREIPQASAIAARLPDSNRLLVETFGSPFSPLNESELQIDLVRALNLPAVLVSSSALGAIGRTLSTFRALQAAGITPFAVALVGPTDEYAIEQIEQYTRVPVIAVPLPVQRAGSVSDEPSWQDRDQRSVWHPYTSLRHPDRPLHVVGAEAEFLHLADGRRLIDGISSWWTILHGHREPRLMAALAEATKRFDHVLFAGVTHEPAVRVAELLLESAPWQGGRVFFSDNGSTSVEVALKMAYQLWCHRGEPRRSLFIGFDDSYHGDTFGAMAVGRDPLFFGRFEPLLCRAERVPVSPDRLDEVLTRHAGQVAAVIIEPLVQGAGGMKMHSPATLKAIFEVTRNHGVLFIADEVMTGCYRTGSMWAFEQAGIAPDLICTSKTLAGGILPLAATIASPEIVAGFDTAERERTFFHGHSFTAHPLACAIAAENLHFLKQAPPTAPARFAHFWHEALTPLRDTVRDIRIQGTIAAIEFDTPGGYLADSARAMHQRCVQAGVFLRPLGNVLYAMPPLNASQESLMRIAEVMRQAG